MRYLYVPWWFCNALGVQHRNLSITIVLNYVRVAYVNLIATGIVFNIRASSTHISTHIGRMMAFSEHWRWIISVFERRSIMNRLYWHNQQVGYLCFIPFVWEQRGVIAAVADQTTMISHLLPMCWISEQKDTLSCQSSHLLCLFKWSNRHERPMLSQSELLCLEICVDHLGN